MKRIITYLLPLAVLVASCNQNHLLFSNGNSPYTIVVAPGAAESEQYAAQELQQWIQKVGNVKLPINSTGEGRRGHRLIVGYNGLTSSLVPGSKPQGIKDESFRYCTHDGDILLWGGSMRGTLNAVYSFLERELGCRWYSADVSVAPAKKSWGFNTLDYSDSPALRMRNVFYYEPNTDSVFAARLRSNQTRLPSIHEGQTIEGSSERYWNCHTMGQFVPEEKYFKDHPEYFSLIDGKRTPRQLCLSNPDVLKICIEELRKAMRGNPDYLIYSLSQNDGGEEKNACECPECQRIDNQYGGKNSGIVLWFVNQAADAVRDEFPDKYVGTFAYRYTRHAPVGIKPRDNVVIRLCSIECCIIHAYDCPENQDFAKDLRDWSVVAPHLYIWDYVTGFSNYHIPLPNLRALQSHVQAFRDNNAIGVMEQGGYENKYTEMSELRTYLLSRLLWNPEVNVDSVLTDFTNGYYGAAAPAVREYINFEHNVLALDSDVQDCYPWYGDDMFFDEFAPEARKIIAKGREAVAGDAELQRRLDLVEFPLCVLQMERTPQQALEQGAYDLFLKVTKREGMTFLNEWDCWKNRNTVQRFIDKFEKLKTQ